MTPALKVTLSRYTVDYGNAKENEIIMIDI